MSRPLIFGLNCYLASMAALFIAFCFELPNPWWAAITVLITSQPITGGAIWAKAIYRIAGTLIGLAMALLIIPNLVDAPELMMLLLALWLSLCLFVALQIRTPRSYVILLAGYSVTLVGLPIIDDASTVFDTAIARTEEILIGVLCSGVIHGLIFPFNTGDVWSSKLRNTLEGARTWIPKAIQTPEPHPYEKARITFPADVVDLAMTGASLRYEPRATRTIDLATFALERRLFSILPLVAGIERRLFELNQLSALDAQTLALLRTVADWIGANRPVDETRVRNLQQACTVAIESRAHPSIWADIVRLSLIHRLSQLVTEWGDCIALAQHIADGKTPIASHLTGPFFDPRSHAFHIDRGLAFISALTAGTALMALAVFAMIAKWPVATTGIGIAAVMTALFATFDDPTPIHTRFLIWTFISVPIAMFYVFAVLPAITDFTGLAIVLFPLITTVAYFMAIPKHMVRALAAGLVLTTLIGLQPVYRADFTSFSNQVVSAIAGILVTYFTTKIFRVFSPAWVRKRVDLASRRDLINLLRRNRRSTVGRLASRMLDRVGMITSRLASNLPEGQAQISQAMRNLHLGVNVTEILEAVKSLPVDDQSLIRQLRGNLANYLRNKEADRELSAADMPDASPVAWAFANLPRTRESVTGLSAAVGLQLTLHEAEHRYA